MYPDDKEISGACILLYFREIVEIDSVTSNSSEMLEYNESLMSEDKKSLTAPKDEKEWIGKPFEIETRTILISDIILFVSWKSESNYLSHQFHVLS